MIEKQCQFAGRDDNGSYVHLLHAGYDNDHLVKEAQASPALLDEVSKIAKSFPKDPGKMHLLVSAMGASEYWGQNCLPAGTPVLMADGGCLPIEAISVGDEVISHTGNVRKVTRSFVHDAEGLVSVRPQGHARPLRTTSGHPYYAVRKEDAVRLRRSIVWQRDADVLSLREATKEYTLSLSPEWIEAGDLCEGDLVFLKVDTEQEVHPELDGIDTATILGLYAAEGCIGRRRRKDRKGEPWQDFVVIFTLGGHEGDKADKLVRLLKERGLSPRRTDQYQGNCAIRVEAYSQKLARLCRDHVGKGAHYKHLSPSVMRMPKEWQAAFIASYAGGDGCYRGPGRGEGGLRISTASEELAIDVRMLLARLGFAASVIPGRQHHTSWGAGNKIFEISLPAGQLNQRRTTSESAVHPDGYLVCPVKSVYYDESWRGRVYNIEVDRDNSYVADHVVVHNSNGDIFPEEALIHTPPNWMSLPLNLRRSVGAAWEWGYPTFYNAHPFQHHQNKDPERAFGEVTYATWDPFMKRVVLVVTIDVSKAVQEGATRVIDKINNGEFCDVSMGCRVPFDLCSYCTDWDRVKPYLHDPKKLLEIHKRDPIRGLSETRFDYCEHLKNSLNKIFPNGIRVGMYNFHPRFFDISFVFIGADKTSKVMAKLAAGLCPIRESSPVCGKGCTYCSPDIAIPSSHVYEVWSRGEKEKTAMSQRDARLLKRQLLGPVIIEKDKREPFRGFNQAVQEEERMSAPLDKRAELIKRIQSGFARALPSIERQEPDIPKSTLTEMGKNLPGALRTTGALGIVLKPREFQRSYLTSIGGGRLADELDNSGMCFRPGAPPTGTTMMGSSVVPTLISRLLPMLASRSCYGPPLHHRVVHITINVRKRPDSDCVDDPFMSKLSSAYTDYRRELLYKYAGIVEELVDSHPEILGDIFEKDLEQVFSGRGIAKTGGNVVESLIGMLPTMYLNSAHMNGPVSEYVQEHPSLDGVRSAGVLAAASGGVA